MTSVIGLGMASALFIGLFFFIRWLVKYGELAGEKKIVVDAQEKSAAILREINEELARKAKLHEAIHDSLPDTWNELELRRKKGKVDIRSTTATKM